MLSALITAGFGSATELILTAKLRSRAWRLTPLRKALVALPLLLPLFLRKSPLWPIIAGGTLRSGRLFRLGNWKRRTAGCSQPISNGPAQESPFLTDLATGESLLLDHPPDIGVFNLQINGCLLKSQNIQRIDGFGQRVIGEELL